MATEKLNEGQSVQVETLQVAHDTAIDEINVLPEAIARTRRRSLTALYIFILFLLSIFLARVPYVGSYPDAYLFEFIFGNVKFVVYGLLIILMLLKIFNLKIIKLFHTKRFILGYFLLIVGCVLTLAIVQKYLLVNTVVDLQTYINGFTNWATNSTSQIYTHFMPDIWAPANQTALDAGVIGTLLVIAWQYVAAVLLGLVALILIIFSILVFINRTDSKGITLIRKWLIHLLGGNLYSNEYDELSTEKNDVKPVVHQAFQIKKEANKSEQITPPISFLTDTSVDHYYDNKSQAQKYQQGISKFIRRLKIDASYQNTVVMPQYTEISFEVSTKTDIESILKDKDDLLSYLKLEKFNISFKGNIVKFEIPNKVISKISVRQIFDSLKTVNNDEAIAGIGFDNVPLIVNFTKSPNVLIIGRRGSGAAMLLTILLTTLAYINTPNELEYNLLSPLGDKSLKYLDDLPQMQSSLISDPEECIGKLHQILDVIKERENKFKEVGAKTLDEYNKFQESPSTKLKTIVLAISSFDSLIKNSLQNLEIMSNILERGRNVGIKTILLAINVNNESAEKQIYEQIDARFILRLESERESLKIFDNYRGIQLLGNGDGYYFNDTKKLRFQTCYLNANELIETVKIIKTFYNSKEESN